MPSKKGSLMMSKYFCTLIAIPVGTFNDFPSDTLFAIPVIILAGMAVVKVVVA